MLKKYMKKLINLNDNIKSMNDMDISGLDGKPLTYKGAIISYCELFKPKTTGNGDMLRAFDLGINIQKSDNEMDILDEDIQFLIRVINETPIFITIVTGRVIKYLENITE